MLNLLYTPLIGFPLSVMLFAVGLILCVSIIGLPVGFACFALAVKVLTLSPRPRVVVRSR